MSYQIDSERRRFFGAGVLSVGYAEAGPADVMRTLLLERDDVT